jgi:hypothetical protein
MAQSQNMSHLTYNIYIYIYIYCKNDTRTFQCQVNLQTLYVRLFIQNLILISKAPIQLKIQMARHTISLLSTVSICGNTTTSVVKNVLYSDTRWISNAGRVAPWTTRCHSQTNNTTARLLTFLKHIST